MLVFSSLIIHLKLYSKLNNLKKLIINWSSINFYFKTKILNANLKAKRIILILIVRGWKKFLEIDQRKKRNNIIT